MDTKGTWLAVVSLLVLTYFVPIGWCQTELSLEGVTARVLAQNRRVHQARAAVQVRKEEAAAARAKRLPVLNTSVQAGPILNRASVMFPRGSLGEYASAGPIPGEDTRIGIPRRIGGYSVSQMALPLSQQPRIGLGIRSANLEALCAEEEAETVAQQMAAQARGLYFQIVALERARTAAASQIKVAEELVRLAERGGAEGTSLPAEQAEARSRLARAQADAVNLEADIQNGHEQLNLLMGEPLDAHFQLVPGFPAPGALSLGEARARAAANRPEIREASLRLEQAGLAIRSKRLEWIPDVSLTLTHVGFLNAGNLAPRQFAIAGLSLNWEPWDWGRKNREIRVARQRGEQARLALEHAEAQAEFEVGRAWREWDRAERDLDVAHRAAASSAELLRVARQRYEQQAALLRALLEAQAAWESALQQESRAAAAVGIAWANLQLAMGAKL